jgi:N-acetylmuramoyl-L-alanine amidase
MKKLVIMIDPGHGGADPGAPRENPIEAVINLAVAERLKEQGFDACLTRREDSTVSLEERVSLERRCRPDLFVSLHCNAAENPAARGIEVWTSPGDTAADPAATEIFKALSQAFPDWKLRTDYSDGDPDKEARFRVLVGTVGPAVLVEMGFVSHPEERALLLDTSVQTRMALAIASGVLAWAREAA